jgi:hypothetical protein
MPNFSSILNVRCRQGQGARLSIVVKDGKRERRLPYLSIA